MGDMTTWTRQQVAQVSGLRTTAWLDDYTVMSTGGNALEWTKDRLCRMFIAEARVSGVEVHAADVQYRETRPDDRLPQMRIDAYWEPQTQEIELHGGEKDGEVMAVRNPYEPIIFAVSRPMQWTPPTEAAPYAPSDRIIYRQAGWREEERRWVFKP